MRKKFFVSIVAVVLAMSICLSTAFANYNTLIYTYYTDTVTAFNGTGKYVRIDVYNNGDGFVNDVRMLGWNGEVVWEEYGAIGASGSRTFWCGSDVAVLQVKVRRVSGSYYIATCSCNVIFP